MIRSIATALLGATLVSTLAMTTVAQAEEDAPTSVESPATGADASPIPSTEAAATSHRWPTLPPPGEVPVGKQLRPDGLPDVAETRHGVRVELWLSSSSVVPGEWVQALVRTTNLRDTPVWSWSGECLTSGTRLGVELGDTIPPGKAQTGNAGLFKRHALRRWNQDAFTPWRYLDDLATNGSGLAFVECVVLPGPLKLKAGASRDERFAWYPAHSFDGGAWFQPPYPGTVEVTVSWPYLSRGARPKMGERKAQRSVKPIKASARLEITGDGPGTPSVPELVDIALEDPEFRAWVDRVPSRERFCRFCVSVDGWSGPTYEHHLWLRDVPNAPATGVVSVELAQGGVFGTRGIVSMDPWTGEVLDVRFL